MYKASVIIPIFNSLKYLERCIQSVVKQTAFTDCELILIDDGSTDGSSLLCDQYQAKYNNVVAYHQQNTGLALARQKGVSIASGKYIFFLDSDDWLPTTNIFELLFNYSFQYGSDLICGDNIKISDDSLKIESNYEKNINQLIITDTKQLIHNLYISRKINTSACAKLIKKDLFAEITFPKNLAIGEEHDMIAQIILKAKKVVVLDKVIYAYYQHQGSISKSGYNKKYANSLINYINLRKMHADLYPMVIGPISAFYCEYEMAVITAMCRNWTFDWDTINLLRKDLKNNLKYILKNDSTKLVFKISAVLIIYATSLFIILFRIWHLFTGR